MTPAECVPCTECPPGTYRGASWLACAGNGLNDTQNDCVPCSQCDAGSYKSPSYIPCDGTSYTDTQGSCLSCEQECLPGEYRALCQQSAIESMHCEGTCTKFVDLKTRSKWTGIFLTAAALGSTGQPLWVDLKFNTSTSITRILRSAAFPITVHKFIDGSVGQFGGAVTVSLEAQSCTCSPCGPGTSNGKDDGTPCRACAPGNYSDAGAGTKCSICAAGKFSPKSGASACQDCPAWAMSLPGKDRCSARPAPPPSPFEVVIVLGSPLAPREFTLEVQGAFRGAIAAAAGVDVMVCQISDISPGARRAGGSEVALAIGAASSEAAAAISGGLTADAINSEMAKVGLPGVSILSMGVFANDAFDLGVNTSVPLNATDFWTQNAGPLQVWVWMTIGGGVLLLLCCCCCILLLLRARKGVDPGEADEQVTADADTVIIDMKPEPMEHESTLTGELVFRKVSSDEEDTDEADVAEAAELEGVAREAMATMDEDSGDQVAKKERKTCAHCSNFVCKPEKDLHVELHSLNLLPGLNDSKGTIVKLYKKRRMCVVDLEDGQSVTVQFKNIRCSEPRQQPDPGEPDGAAPAASDAASGLGNAEAEQGHGERADSQEVQADDAQEPTGDAQEPADDAQEPARSSHTAQEDDVVSVVASVAPSLVSSIAESVAALGGAAFLGTAAQPRPLEGPPINPPPPESGFFWWHGRAPTDTS